MSAELVIREATSADLSAVSRLLGETWHATYDGIYGRDRVSGITSRWHSQETLQRGIGQKNSTFLVVVRQGAISGTLSAESCDDGSLVKLARLYVHPASQGAGLGRALYAAMLAGFPSAKSVTLEVEPANTKAVAFYVRLGFAVAGTVADCGGSGDRIPAIKMIKDLGA